MGKSICFVCSKRVGLLGFHCSSCKEQFCSIHRMPEDHKCSEMESLRNKYKQLAKEKLEKEAFNDNRVIRI